MAYTISSEKPFSINWSVKGKDRILQNVINLLNTYKSEIPYMRNMGISKAIIDKPFDQIRAPLTSQIVGNTRLFEPRASITYIDVTGVDEGNIKVSLVVDI